MKNLITILFFILSVFAYGNLDVTSNPLTAGSYTFDFDAGNLEMRPGAGTEEEQFLYLYYAATSGTYKLDFNGQITTTLNWNDDAGTVQAALEALSNVGSGNVTVTGSFTDGSPPTGFYITFTGDLRGTDVTEVQFNSFALQWSGGAYPGWAVWINTIQPGGKGYTAIQLDRKWYMMPGTDSNTMRFRADDIAEPSVWEFVGKWNPSPGGAYHGLNVLYKGQRISNIFLGYGPWDAVQPGVITPSGVWLMLGAGGGGRYQTTIYLDPVNKRAYGSDGLIYTGWGGSETNPPRIAISRTSGRYQWGHFIDEVTVGNMMAMTGTGFEALISQKTDVSLTADDTVIDVSGKSYLEISSDDGTPANRTFTYSTSNILAGHEVKACWSGTNAGELLNAGTHKIGSDWTPGQYDCIVQVFDGTNWKQTSRSDN